MSKCRDCGAQIVWARNEGDTKWLRPLEPEAKVAEPSTGHVLIVQIDGEWRSVSKVRQHAFHVCPEPEPTGTIDFVSDDEPGEPSRADDLLTRPEPTRQPRTKQEIREEAERKRAVEVSQNDKRQIERHWSSPRRVEIMAFDCPTCPAKAGEPCRPLATSTDYTRWYRQSFLNQPHPERTALAPPFMPPWKVRKAALEAECKAKKDHVPVDKAMDLKTTIPEKQIHLLGNWVRQHGALLLDLETPDDE